MNRMSKLTARVSLVGASIATLAVLSGCNEAPPAAPPPPPEAASYQSLPPAPPPLLGAPPPQQQDFVGMAPIANPEDMTPEERARVYGARYHVHHHGDRSPGWWLRLHGMQRSDMGHPPMAYPIVHATRPPPVTAVGPKPVAVVKPVMPKLVAAPPPKPVVAPAPSPVAQLATAVAGKSKGAMLAVPADLSAAKPGAVTLSLPADLFATIRQQAAKLGLGHAARKTDVTATLQGDGYAITPNGPQTAHLVAGKPTTFTWQVAPGPAAKGPLTADVGALLKGAGDTKAFSLAELKQAVAAVDAAVQQAQAAGGFKMPGLDMLSIPGHKTVTLPVIGKTPSKSLVGAAIVLLILALLVLAARSASARREAEERQRRYRTRAAALNTDSGLETVTPVAAVVAPQVDHVAAPVEHEPIAKPVLSAYPVAEVVEDHAVMVEHPIAEAVVEHHPVVEHDVLEQPFAQPVVARPVVVEAQAAPVHEGPSVVGLAPAEPEPADHALAYPASVEAHEHNREPETV